mgnify:CR=1 FL=1
MTNPSVLILRITAAVIIILIIAVTALAIRRNQRRERDRHDGHPRYRSSSLDSGIGLPDDGVTDFEAGGVEMHKTSRLNPGFFSGGKAPEPPKPRGKPPEHLIPLTIMAPQGRPFSGKTVAQLMKNFGLQYSPNRTYELLTGGGQEVFCTLLNIRKPPIFPPNLDSADVSYEGLLIVLQLPVSQEPVRDWETFIALVNEMSESCGGKLCDHNRRPLHERDLERLRKKIETYEGQYHAWLRG